MKRFILHKVHDCDSLYGGWDWSIRPVEDGNMVSSTPWEVEVPDDFSLEETVSGEMMFFREGHDLAYSLSIGRSSEGGNPYLISADEMVKLTVIREIGWKEWMEMNRA